MEKDEKWHWMMRYCKRRGYSPDWGWKFAEEAYASRQAYLKKWRDEFYCWYCQLGVGASLMALRDIPEPPDWKDTLCEKHLESITPVHQDGDIVVCMRCDTTYKYYPWNTLMGRQDKRCFCRTCVAQLPERSFEHDRLVEGEPEELDHLTNYEKTQGCSNFYKS